MKKTYYFDSSAWFKRYFRESGSEEVPALMAQADKVCVSEVGVPEIFSILRRQVREGLISEDQYKLLKRAVGEDLREATVLALDPGIVGEAIQCLEMAVLQGCDSIHVATARAHHCALFVSADLQQCKAAKKLGLKVRQI